MRNVTDKKKSPVDNLSYACCGKLPINEVEETPHQKPVIVAF